MRPGQKTGSGEMFTAGTLRYTRFSLTLLFFWLLWGSFTYLIMEAVIPNVLPLLLRQHQASNTEISIIVSSLNVLGNTLVNPIVSFISDRHRGKGGRRRPFIIYSTPFVVLFLGLIPFGPEIAAFLSSVPVVSQALAFSPVVPAILLIGVFVMGFQIFDVFVGAVYSYLVRDTMPEEFLGRFSGVARLVGGVAPLVWNLLIFPHAETCMKAVFVGVAAFYGFGVMLMCWKVKEGEYPPPEPLDEEARRGWFGRLCASVKLYVMECLCDRVYLAAFLGNGFSSWAMVTGVFSVLFYREELGLSLTEQGKVNAASNVLSLLIAVPIGYLIDRYNYFRLTQLGALFQGLICFVAFFVVRDVPTLLAVNICSGIPRMFFVLGIGRTVIAVYPKERYGQFGSASSAFSSFVAIGLSVLAAKFIDFCGSYRSLLIWQGAFMLVAGLMFLFLERRWLKLGGWKDYKAP